MNYDAQEHARFSAGLRRHVAPQWYEDERRELMSNRVGRLVFLAVAAGWVAYVAWWAV